MRLNSIYIKGFKSFYKDVLINFNENVTGIVGPNGSGKSNIVDAIRWVLGEQKPTELRLDNMSDVLFNGTEKRKKSSMAQVTITFDNTKNLLPTEYNTVAITRVLYRTGESEYQINGVQCRLKDVRSLFIDTGIGSDSYAIIALNMVEDILSDTNGSRRFMFEQASGISKFKKRKKETLSKLKLTKVDLDRVEDLLYEIETNLKDLEKQARRAEKYIKIRSQYKDQSIKLHLLKYDNNTASAKELETKINNELSNYRQYETQIITLNADLEKHKNIIDKSEKDLSDFQRKINKHSDHLRDLENKKQLLSQKINFDQNKHKSLKNEKEEIKNELSKVSVEIEKFKNRITDEKIKELDFNNRFESIEKEYFEIKNKYELIKSSLDSVKIKKKDLSEKKLQLIKTKTILQNNIDNLNQSNKQLSQRIADINKNLLSTKNNKIQLEAEEKELVKNLEIILKEAQQKDIRINNLNKEKEEIKIELDKIERKIDSKENELKLLKSMYDNLEGFPESIKYLNKNWSKKFPLLTDVLSTSDEYKVAIETFLSPYLNYYVVDNFVQAIDAIDILRKSQKGKANFFVLDRIKNIKNNSSTPDHLIAAKDIVEYDEKYSDLIMTLLNNVYISVLDMDFVRSGENEEIIVLDKTGTFIYKGISVSGGSVGLFEGKKIGRKKNIEKLKSDIEDLISVKNEMRVAFEMKKDEINILQLNKDKESGDEYEKLLNELRTRLLRTNINIENLQIKLNEFNSQTKKNEIKIRNYYQELAKIDNDIVLVERELSNIELKSKDSGGDIDEIMAELSAKSEKRNNAKIEFIKQQNLVKNIDGEIEFKVKISDDLKGRLKKIDSEISFLNLELSKNKKELENIEQALIKQYELKYEYQEGLSEYEKRYFEDRNIIKTLEEENSKLKHQLGKSQFLINQLREQKMSIDFKRKSIEERLKIEFNLELKDVLNMERTEDDEFVLEDKVEKLRRRLENYGEVNTLAVEAYNEMKQRHETIQNQREDILNAEKSLKRTINEIENTATERFLSAFGDIREHFKSVFTTLFKEGDTCDIFLEDEDAPLDSKIKIVAKPKGKRPKTLSQLSGGEKTLTAIALLFALYLYKPAPFCIFDEVDAPLDDTNIMKFNNIIREFSKNSQFIVVTHNKATMTAVDVLYGVFMQELGVSEVAQVDFRNYDELKTV